LWRDVKLALRLCLASTVVLPLYGARTWHRALNPLTLVLPIVAVPASLALGRNRRRSRENAK
jgi:hypothetical protein